MAVSPTTLRAGNLRINSVSSDEQKMNRRDLLLQNLQILIEPDIHLISTSMIPSIIRNQCEFLILHRNLTISSLIEHLSIGLDSLHRERRSALRLSIRDAITIYH